MSVKYSRGSRLSQRGASLSKRGPLEYGIKNCSALHTPWLTVVKAAIAGVKYILDKIHTKDKE